MSSQLIESGNRELTMTLFKKRNLTLIWSQRMQQPPLASTDKGSYIRRVAPYSVALGNMHLQCVDCAVQCAEQSLELPNSEKTPLKITFSLFNVATRIRTFPERPQHAYATVFVMGKHPIDHFCNQGQQSRKTW